MKLEPPKMTLRENGKDAKAAFQIQYTYFFNPKSGSSFNAPTAQPADPSGTEGSTSWNLTITHHTATGGESTP